MTLTPGLRFLLGHAHFLSIPLLFLVGGRELTSRGMVNVPFSVLVMLGLVSVPLLGGAQTTLRRRRDGRNANANSARMVPVVRGRFPGNLDVLFDLLSGYVNGYLGDAFHVYFDKYGPILNLNILGDDNLFTLVPSHLKEILATNFENFEKGSEFDDAVRSVLGTGVFNSDGEMWKFHRGLTRPHLTRQKIRDFDIFDRHCQAAIEKMKARFQEGYSVDVQDLLSRFTMDTATEFLLGCSVETLSTTLAYPYGVVLPPRTPKLSGQLGVRHGTVDPDEFSRAFQEAQDIAAHRLRLGYTWPLHEIFHDKTSKHMKVVSRFIDPIVDAALERHARNNKMVAENQGNMDNATLLDHLISHTSDPQVLKDEALNILIAGRDTTAGTLAFAMHFLGLDPNVFQRVRREVLDKIGPSRRPSWEEMKEMKYLQAVINETLRLYPAVPFNIKKSKEACLFPSPTPEGKPIYIPPGSNVSYSLYLMHRQKDLWGPDAEEFDPDRFIDDRLKKYLLKNPFIFLPFNAGPRICLGQQYAYNEMSFWLVRFLQSFSSMTLDKEAVVPELRAPKEWEGMEGRKGQDGFRPFTALTLSVKGGVWIKATEDVEHEKA